MPIENSLSFKGLATSPNNLGAGSEGALVVADNVTIRYPDVLEPRRGQEAVAGVVDAVNYMTALRVGPGYLVTTDEPHGYVSGQQVYVVQDDLESAYLITVFSVNSPTDFAVIAGSSWPGDPPFTGGSFQSIYTATYPQTAILTFPVSQVAFFQDEIALHSETLDKIKFVDAASPLVGNYSAADPDYRLKTAISASVFYMATTSGVMALEQASSTVPRLSGIAEPLKPFAGAVVDPTSPPPTIQGFLAPEKAVAYRVLFGYVDSHDAVHLGPPSVRVTIKNSSTTNYASGKLLVPLYTAPTDVNGNIVEGTFVRVYRSVMADTEAATSDELYLVNETVIDRTAYTTSSVLTLADTAAQEFAVQSAPLYTNATQGGLPNDAPPYARDLANWDSRLWYANTEQPYSLTAQLVGVEGGGNPTLPATGLRVRDTLTINGVVFTAWGSTIPSERKFAVWTSGTAAENISITLEQLQDVVNDWHKNNASFDIWAYLEPVVFGDQLLNFKIRFQRPSVSEAENTAFDVVYTPLRSTATVTGTPGAYTITTVGNHSLKVGDFVLMSRSPPSSLFPSQTIQVEAPITATTFSSSLMSGTLPQMNRVQRLYGNSVWTPDLSAGVAAENERRQNAIYYSNQQEPEAVSAANYLLVGTSGRAIKRVVPQRDRLLVFKEEGTYAVYGDFPYQVSLVDDTVQILAPDSAIALGSTVFVLTDDGVLAITDGGIQMVSKPIDSTLKPYLASGYRDTTATAAFGVSYESEKVFALFMPTLAGAGSDYTAKAYVYGLESGAWTTWSFSTPRLCGRVDPVLDAAYYGLDSSPYLVRDRNTSSTADYEDEGNLPILSTVRWASTTLGTPHATKQAREIHAHFRDIRKPAGKAVTPQLIVKTDIVPAGGSINNLWLVSDTFSTATTIGPSVLPLQFRKLVPQAVQRATYYSLELIMTTLGAYWALNGYSIVFENTSERTGTVR